MNVRTRRVAWFAVAVGVGAWCLPSTTPHAQEIPSNLQVVGQITGNDSLSPEQGDTVQAVSNGNVEGEGNIRDERGTYFIDMSKDQSFNGTVLTLRLRKDNTTFQLEFGPDNQFTYSGSFPFPNRKVIDATIGGPVGGSGGGSGGSGGGSGGSGGGSGGSGGFVGGGGGSGGDGGFAGGGSGGGFPGGGSGGSGGGSGGSGGGSGGDSGLPDDLKRFDVNQDGAFTQADIDAIRRAIKDGTSTGRADVDGNGIVNTRDAISAIRAYSSMRRDREPRVRAQERASGGNGN
jgi:hypothetical protein